MTRDSARQSLFSIKSVGNTLSADAYTRYLKRKFRKTIRLEGSIYENRIFQHKTL